MHALEGQMAKMRISAKVMYFSVSLVLLGAVCIPQPSFGEPAPITEDKVLRMIQDEIAKNNNQLLPRIREIVRDEIDGTRHTNSVPSPVKTVIVHKSYCCHIHHRRRPPCWWDY